MKITKGMLLRRIAVVLFVALILIILFIWTQLGPGPTFA